MLLSVHIRLEIYRHTLPSLAHCLF
jgi:hypothetical protein